MEGEQKASWQQSPCPCSWRQQERKPGQIPSCSISICWHGASNSSVQGYMNWHVGPGSSVTVTGSQAPKNYNGDSQVVGPATGKPSLILRTRGTAQHLTTRDTFIKTFKNLSTARTDHDELQWVAISSVSFLDGDARPSRAVARTARVSHSKRTVRSNIIQMRIPFIPAFWADSGRLPTSGHRHHQWFRSGSRGHAVCTSSLRCSSGG